MPKPIDKPPSVLYLGQKFRVLQTANFATYLPALRDRRAIAKVNDRLLRLADGNFGDVKDEGKGVSALRIDYGPGYRIYISQRGRDLVILLCGGDKRTQKRDIAFAHRLKAELDRGIGTNPV